MDLFTEKITGQRISQAAKNKNGKQWYKDQIDTLDHKSFSNNNYLGFGGISEYKRKKVNYDLFNNIINLKDLEYVCKPYGSDQIGEMPANMVNRDIVSGKIKVLIGMEMKMPFSWKAFAVNEEATTRKETEEFNRLKEFVVNTIMQPIKQELEATALAETKGRNLTPQEQEQLSQQIAQELEARTPDEVRRYMIRDHQDPAEVMIHQLLEYTIQKLSVRDKFNKAWKHALISGEEIYWIGVLNGEPAMTVVNPLFFDHDKSPDLDYIEDGEWAVCEYRMTPSDIVTKFGSELTNAEIDEIYSYNSSSGSQLYDGDFTFNTNKGIHDHNTLRVLHGTWKSLRKVGFLTYMSPLNEEPQMKLVDENYKLNKEYGDISISWEYIPEAHETWKIGSKIYVYMRPVPGQHKDLDNLWECKLPYYGACYDNLNSEVTSMMDRIKAYQYFSDIAWYRLELVMASDKGKKFAVNASAIPRSLGLDIQKTLYFLESSGVMFLNPAEEGNKAGTDVTNMVKEIDMSLASDLKKYVDLIEFIDRKCGESIGVTKAMEGAVGTNDAVGNTRQNLIQNSHIIQPYFELHNIIKGNCLQALIQVCKYAYADGKAKKLPYILDDMSFTALTTDPNLLDSTTYGIFVSNSSKAYDAKEMIQSLAQAALQNQRADLSDIVKIIRSESVQEAEELLEASEEKKNKEIQNLEKQKLESQERVEKMRQENQERLWEHEKEMVILKEKEQRETEIQKQLMFSMGFDENKDRDEDGVPDVLEVAKHGLNAQIQNRKLSLEENKFAHQQEVDKEKISIEKKKLNKKPSK